MITSHDIFDRLAIPSVPRLGDTEYSTVPSGARATAGLVDSWDARVPVVYAGDGTASQGSLNGAADVVSAATSAASSAASSASSVASSIIPDSVSSWFGDKINHTLLGALGIIVIALGLFFIVKE